MALDAPPLRHATPTSTCGTKAPTGTDSPRRQRHGRHAGPAPAARRGRLAHTRLVLDPAQFVLLTLRPSNVEDPKALRNLITALAVSPPRVPVVLPLPGLRLPDEARVAVVTDSGGMQEETTRLGVPCLTLRTTTERPVTIQHGTSELVPPHGGHLLAALAPLEHCRPGRRPRPGSGTVEGRSASRPCLCASCGGARDPPLRIRLRDGTVGSARCARISCPRCLWRSPPRHVAGRDRMRRRPRTRRHRSAVRKTLRPTSVSRRAGTHRPTSEAGQRPGERGVRQSTGTPSAARSYASPTCPNRGRSPVATRRRARHGVQKHAAPRAMGPAARVVQRQQQTDLEARTPCRAESGSASPSLPGTHLLRRRAPTGVGPGERGAHGCGCVLVQYCGGDRRGTRRGSPPACARGRVLGAKFLALADP